MTMPGPLYAIDTHTLYWFEFGLPALSTAAENVFAEAEQGRAELVVHPIVLAELDYILRKKGQEADFPVYLAFIENNPIYRVEPMTLEDLRRLPDYPEIGEMHDRLIAIQAGRLGAVLITKDANIQASPQVRWLW